MARLTAATRRKLPSSTFAGPGRSYPIPDRSHAIAAESMSKRYASPGVRAQVLAKVRRKFPGLGESVKHEEIRKSLGK